MYAEPVCYADIYYGRALTEEWKNLTCAKELLHIMDGQNGIKRKEQFDNLVKSLTLPFELEVFLDDPPYAQVDKIGDIFAAALLIPLGARSLLLGPYNRELLNTADIARLALLPPHLVKMVMSDKWEAAVEKMCTSF